MAVMPARRTVVIVAFVQMIGHSDFLRICATLP